MNSKVFNVLRTMAEVIIPALATFYMTIAAILSLPYAEQVTGVSAAVCVLIGSIVSINRINYNSKEGDTE